LRSIYAQAGLPHLQVIVVLDVEVKCVLVKNPYFNAWVIIHFYPLGGDESTSAEAKQAVVLYLTASSIK
jgi:hypothetical protein